MYKPYIGSMATTLTQKAVKLLLKILDPNWGRYEDRSFDDSGPSSNPDDTSPEQQFDFSANPYVKSGMLFRDISHLFVSARGLEPEKKGDPYYPAQLIYTTPGLGDQEILDALAWQYDEEFQGRIAGNVPDSGFANILKSLDNPVKTYGRAIGEIQWYRREKDPYKGLLFADFVWSRDPQEYVFDPPDEKPGLYKETMSGYEAMNPNQFLWYSYDSLYNNPYGTSINKPLEPWIKTWVKVFGYWRNALQKAGLGSWVAKYDETMAGNTAGAKAKRTELRTALKEIIGGSGTIINKSAELEKMKLEIEAEAFLNWHESFIRAVSILYTGDATSLTEGRYGSRAKSESTEVREKSKREQLDALRVSAFWTFQFNRIFVDLNFPPDRIKIYPTLQLIQPERIMPTTPQGQEHIDDTEPKQEPEKEKELRRPIELQEEEPEPPIPPAVPAGQEDFPNDTDTPESYRSVAEEAKNLLSLMPVKNYSEVTSDEAPYTFTIKRLRGYGDVVKILTDLKNAIIPTLDLENEAQAWDTYYTQAVQILKGYGVAMTPGIRDDLHISFRQARQNAYGRALLFVGKQQGAVGIRIRNLYDGHEIRTVHKFWDNIVLRLDDPRLERVLPPSDFGCLCFAELEFNPENLTPESELPTLYPGETYKYYAPPRNIE